MENVTIHGVEILIAEDSRTQAEQLKYLLEAQGYRVTVAANGKQALASVRKRKPTLLISDIMMPEMDGYGLCTAIKSDPETKDIPVILLTTLASPEDVIKGLECCADNFIRKPYDEKYLFSRVQYILTNRELRKTDNIQMGIEIFFGGKRHFITAERQQILDLLISTYEGAIHVNEELKAREKDLEKANAEMAAKHAALEAANAALRESEVRLRSIDRMKSEFMATVSHEIRTPLASLLGFSELLLNRNVPVEKRQQFLETIHRETKRLTALINDFLDLQRIESGSTTYNLRAIDLHSVVRAVEQVFTGQMTGQRLIIELPEELPQVRADRDRLEQVFANLLSNAMKYSPQGGDIIISAVASPHEDIVQVSIQDHGLGIPADALPKLFQKFFRVDSTDRRKIGGTGLGLALCREIIKAHGGEISVKSTEGEGTTLTFTLPEVKARIPVCPVPTPKPPFLNY